MEAFMKRLGLATVASTIARCPRWRPTSSSACPTGRQCWRPPMCSRSRWKRILASRFELQNGTNPVVFEAMDSGAMHVHPEVWLPNQQNLYDTLCRRKGHGEAQPELRRRRSGHVRPPRGRPSAPASRILPTLTDPDMAANFDTDGDGMGEIWIGAAGWASTNVEKIRAKVLRL